jgi:hypothetical protein
VVEEGEEAQHRGSSDVVGVQEVLVQAKGEVIVASSHTCSLPPSDLPNFCPSARSSSGEVTPSAR